MFERFLAENISFENGKSMMIYALAPFLYLLIRDFSLEARRRYPFYPPKLDIFLDIINVHFALYAPPFLKQKTRTPKNCGCYHYALKTHFRPQKTVTELF